MLSRHFLRMHPPSTTTICHVILFELFLSTLTALSFLAIAIDVTTNEADPMILPPSEVELKAINGKKA